MIGKKGYILYFDILGYKNLLMNNKNGAYESIKKLLEEFAKKEACFDFKLGHGQRFDETKLLKRHFSDNFLFVYESAKEDFLSLMYMQSIASRIQSHFLYNGFLIRGSILFGTIYYSEEIVFGCDLIKAVQLESHPEPSILIDEELKDICVKNNIKYEKHNALFDVHNDSEDDFKNVICGINKFLGYLDMSKIDNGVLEKISWIIEQTNHYFSPLKNEIILECNTNICLKYRNGETAL